MGKKIDSDGKYQPFRGISTICKLNHPKFAATLYGYLISDKVITQYFAPLPPASYHTTAFRLYNEEIFKSSAAWHTFLEKNNAFFRILQDTLKIEAPDGFKATITGSIFGGVLQLCLELPKALTDTIYKLTEKYDLKSRLGKDFPKFHMTLAYQFKAYDDRVSTYIAERLAHFITSAIARCKITDGLTFHPPRVCSFTSMKQFDSWDPATKPNPFPSLAIRRRLLFSPPPASMPKTTPPEIADTLEAKPDDRTMDLYP